MIDFCEESDLWWSHWIIIWKKELELEYATYDRPLALAFDSRRLPCLHKVIERVHVSEHRSIADCLRGVSR